MWKVIKAFLYKLFSLEKAPEDLIEDTLEENPPSDLPEASDMPEANQQLTKNFHIDEFACHDGTPVPKEHWDNVLNLAKNLQKLRSHLKKPVKIQSGYRTEEYNRKIAGAKNSKHLIASAACIKVEGYDSKMLADVIKGLINARKMDKGGVGVYPTFTHYDVRGSYIRWNGTIKKA